MRKEGWWIVDQSREGSWIGGRRVTQQMLQPGDLIELGKGGPSIKVEWSTAPGLSVGVAPAPTSSFGRRGPMPAVPDSPKFAPAAARTPAAAPAASYPAHHHAPAPSQGNHTALYAIIGVLAVALMGAAIWYFTLGKSSTEDAQLAAAAKQLEPSVGLVVLVINTDNGARTVPLATAWGHR